MQQYFYVIVNDLGTIHGLYANHDFAYKTLEQLVLKDFDKYKWRITHEPLILNQIFKG